MDTNRRPGKEVATLQRMIGKQIGVIARRVSEKNGIPPLSSLEAWIIAYLSRNSGKAFYQKDVEAEFHVSRSTVTRTVQNMEKLGLLERSTDNQDQRMKQVRITAKAAQIHDRICADIFKQIDERIMEGICEEDLQTFYRVIDHMKQNLTGEGRTQTPGIPDGK